MQYAIDILTCELHKCKEALRVVERYSCHPEYGPPQTDFAGRVSVLEQAIRHLQNAMELAATTANTAMDKICPECGGSGLPKLVNQTNCTLCKGRGKLRHC